MNQLVFSGPSRHKAVEEPPVHHEVRRADPVQRKAYPRRDRGPTVILWGHELDQAMLEARKYLPDPLAKARIVAARLFPDA